MPDQNLVNYVRQCQSQGYSPDQIRQTLISQGYNINDISNAMQQNQAMPRMPNQAPAGNYKGPPGFPIPLKGEMQYDSAIIFAVGSIIVGFAYQISSLMRSVFSGSFYFMLSAVMISMILGIFLGGLFGGLVGYLMKWIHPALYNIFKKLPFLKDKVDDLYGFLFWPALIGHIISMIFGFLGALSTAVFGAAIGGGIGGGEWPLSSG